MRAWIYDRLFHNLSKDWYRFIISHIPTHSRLLDVGVGTGSSLLSQVELLRHRSIQVQGIDINASYLNYCHHNIKKLGANDVIHVREQSVYDLNESTPFDAIYFSASFMLLPMQREALRVAKQNLHPTGHICFTQTFELKKSRFMEVIKPLLYMVTSVHFGVVTYQDEFLTMLDEEGFNIVKNEVLKKQGRNREMRAIIVCPKPETTS